MKTARKEIKIGAAVHELLMREAGEFQLSHREYTEAVIRYFASRRLNPKTVREGLAWGLHDAFDKGITKILDMLNRQEQESMALMVASLKEILHEQINTRILIEVLLNNLHQLSEMNREELQQMVQKNSQYALQRKQEILKAYNHEKEQP
ncbi:hypothetical protein [Cesiribacter sp. SM1]|uniref:hypothetical protein n=1 Tax=Cesiribacter sp. SM1 TaxID=2861196 RepID=UPI001CD69365|nr:hypothetical protein [Cesiribacter sp. SM1]